MKFGGISLKNIKILIRREFNRTLDRKKLHLLILAQVIFQLVYFGLCYSRFRDAFIAGVFSFPFLWTCVLLLFYSSTAVSSDRESGIIELIKMAPIKEHEYVVSKLIFSLFLYLIFVLIYLVPLVMFAYAFGWFIITVALLLMVSLNLLFYIFVSTFGILISSIFKKDVGSMIVGFILVMYIFTTNWFLRIIVIDTYPIGPVPMMSWDIMVFSVGGYPDPQLWGYVSLTIIGFIVLLFLSVKRLWRWSLK